SFFNDLTLWENLRLTVFGHWKYGGEVINLTNLLSDLNGTSADYEIDDDGDGVSNAAERLAAFGVSTVPFIENASYFKLREVGLYYRLPVRLLGPGLGSQVRSVRVGVS